MIDCISVGRGDSRKVIPLVRDRDQRKRAAGAIKGWMFPNAEAHRQAMAEGRARAARLVAIANLEATEAHLTGAAR